MSPLYLPVYFIALENPYLIFGVVSTGVVLIILLMIIVIGCLIVQKRKYLSLTLNQGMYSLCSTVTINLYYYAFPFVPIERAVTHNSHADNNKYLMIHN